VSNNPEDHCIQTCDEEVKQVSMSENTHINTFFFLTHYAGVFIPHMMTRMKLINALTACINLSANYCLETDFFFF